MAETIGDMIDKLTISNIRIWHIVDAEKILVKDPNADPNEIRDLADKTAAVNDERNSLIDQINGALAVLIDKARDQNCSTFELTADELLGTGKNKFYRVNPHE
jgi:hypothetical protein